MDKYEYKIREDEIKELIAQRDFDGAAEVADTIDWRRVKSVKMLCMVSDVYKKNRRYEDSRDMLLLAYDRHPGGRTIVYSLCELAIKMGDLGQALEYCKEFIQIAPKDPGRYILQYKLYEAQEVGLEERIAVLEELKKKDYREKWAFELALMYHKVGMETRCVEECDELILWFGEGKYVIKAMELKMQHSPLTEQQQEKYDAYLNPPVEEPVVQEPEAPAEADIMEAATIRVPVEDIDIQVKTLGLSKCDTINLQAEVAAGLKELWGDSEEAQSAYTEEPTKVLVTPTTAEIKGVVEEFNSETAEDKDLEVLAEEIKEDSEPDAITEDVVEEVIEPEEEELIQLESLEWQAEESTEITEDPEQMMLPITEVAQDIPHVEPPKEMAKVLSMEGDGQISFVMPETVALEKQITGQMNFNDIMLEWERMKMELEEKRKENVRQIVLRNTGSMFTDFEASVRDGLLEQLENGKTMEEILPQAENLTVEETGEMVEEVSEDAETLVEEVIEEVETAVEEVAVEEVEASEEAEETEAEAPEEAEEVEAEAPKEAEEVEAEASEEAEEVEAEAPKEAEEVEAEASEEAEEAEAEPSEEIEEPETEDDEVEELVEIEEVVNDDEDKPAESDGVISEEEMAEAEVAFDIVEEFEEYVEEGKEAESKDSEEEESTGRSLTKEEKELFAPYIQGRESKDQLLHALDTISLAAYTGNVIITGREGLDTMGLAKSIVREIQLMDSNFSGKVAKISGSSLNKRDVEEIVEGLVNGALIIQKAGDIDEATAKNLYKVLQQETRGIIVILEGTKRMMNTFFEKYGLLETCFNARIDMEALSDDVLVAFANKYARENECSIDEFGMLALHRTIADRQTSDHAVTIMEVKEIMDDAIASANRKTIGHFFAILAAKRYDDEDMIIIRENDFE